MLLLFVFISFLHMLLHYMYLLCMHFFLTSGPVGTSKLNPSSINRYISFYIICFALFHRIHFSSLLYILNDPIRLSTLFIFFKWDVIWSEWNEAFFFFNCNESYFAFVYWLIQSTLTSLLSACWVFFFPQLLLFSGELEIKPITNPFNHGFNQSHGRVGKGKGGGGREGCWCII